MPILFLPEFFSFFFFNDTATTAVYTLSLHDALPIFILAPDYVASDELVVSLQDHVKNATAPYKYPRVVEFVTELPKTVSGKIRRVELRQQELDKAGK